MIAYFIQVKMSKDGISFPTLVKPESALSHRMSSLEIEGDMFVMGIYKLSSRYAKEDDTVSFTTNSRQPLAGVLTDAYAYCNFQFELPNYRTTRQWPSHQTLSTYDLPTSYFGTDINASTSYEKT